jgi:hypothetical protein
MGSTTELESSSGDESMVPTFELRWENHEPGDDLFPSDLDHEPTLFFHGTASTREEMIDRNGLLPHAGGVALEQIRALVACFDLLGWKGYRVGGCPVLRAYSLNNDFRDGSFSPIYLSEQSSQAMFFAIPATAGGEKLSACRLALGDLRQLLTDTKFRENKMANPEQWDRPEYASNLCGKLLDSVGARLSTLIDLERIAQRELEGYQYAVIYAIRPPAGKSAAWEDCRGMGWRVFEPISPSWFVAKLKIYPPSKE